MGSAAQRWIGWYQVCVLEIFETRERTRRSKSALKLWWLFPSIFPAPAPTVQFDSILSNTTSNQSAVSAQSWHCHGVMQPSWSPTVYDNSINQGLWFRKYERLVQALPTLATCCIIRLQSEDSLYCQSNRIRFQTLFPGDKAAATQDPSYAGWSDLGRCGREE